MPARWLQISMIVIALMVTTIAAYWPVLTCDFVNVDDNIYVWSNPVVQQGLSGEGWTYAWTEIVCANWHPLTILSLEADSTLWGFRPIGYHATNLALHTINVALIFAVLYQMTNSVVRSSCVAALFGLHPLHVESVAWVSERKDVLSTFLFLLMLLAYVRYAKRPSILNYLPVFILLAMGLMAKPMLVTAPVLLLLLDFWPLQRMGATKAPPSNERFPGRSVRMLIREKTPLFGLSLADGIMTVVAQGDARHNVTDLTFFAQLANVFNAYLWYLRKTFVPTHLMAFYPHPGQNLPWISIGAGLAVVCSVTVWVFRQGRQKPYLLTGWGWFVVSLLPVIGLMQVGTQAYADRYAYLPHIGLFVALVWELHSWTARAAWSRIAGATGIVVSLVACGWLTHQQIGTWKNAETLWRHALIVDPNNGRAHLQLAIELHNLGQDEEAVQHMEQGAQLATGKLVANTYYNWALALIALQRDQEAEDKLRTAVKLEPEFTSALEQRWSLLAKHERHQEADLVARQLVRAYINKAKRYPNIAQWQLFVGDIQLRMGNPGEALPYFERALKLNPKDDIACYGLGMAQLQLGNVNGAKASFRRAIDLAPQSAFNHFRLGEILETESNFTEAKRHFAKAVELEPTNDEFRQRLDRLSNR